VGYVQSTVQYATNVTCSYRKEKLQESEVDICAQQRVVLVSRQATEGRCIILEFNIAGEGKQNVECTVGYVQCTVCNERPIWLQTVSGTVLNRNYGSR
jgi:hypothetical protein